MKEKIEEARRLAQMAHTGQVYEGYGEYFVYHVIPVANRVMLDLECGDMELIVAYLHDVLEDTPVTQDELFTEFGKEVLDHVISITRFPGETYGEYIERLCKDPVAVRVKRHDVQQNMACNPSASMVKRYLKTIDRLWKV